MKLAAWPCYEEDEQMAVLDVLRSGRVNYWTGEQCRQFETEFAEYCGVSHGVAVANGTVGLDLALNALGIGAGDEVIVTPRSFFASAGAIVYAGAKPVFAEVDRDSQNISAASIEAVLSPRTRAVICVHLNGWPCDMPAIMALADRAGIAVIEDCAQAHGAAVGGQKVGSWGDIGVFSFCQDKILSTGGEGGLIVTNNADLWQRVWSAKDHGKSYAEVHRQDHPPGFRWLHFGVGSNYRMTEMQAAIGRLQLGKLESWLETRRANAAALDAAFAGLDCVRVPRPPADVRHAYYKYSLFVEPHKLKKDWGRDRILAEFIARGIPGLSGSCPEIYRERAFTDRGLAPATPLPVAHELGLTSIQFPVHPTMSPEQIEGLAQISASVLGEAQA